jgi:hypothetical protein
MNDDLDSFGLFRGVGYGLGLTAISGLAVWFGYLLATQSIVVWWL